MERTELKPVLERAAAERACTVVQLDVDDDNNIEVTIDKEGGADLSDCEYVHRAVLAAFDRNVEDYAMTVSSVGIDAAEADEMLKTIKE